MSIFEPRSRVNAGGDIVRTKLDTSGQDALTNTLKNKQVKFETDELERQMLLSKPQLASKIRKYQNETDINTPNYVQGYTDLVRDHYANFHTSTNVGMEFVRKNEMAVKEVYQASGIKYQEIALGNQDNENVGNYINETLVSIQQDGFIKTGAIDDVKRIIDLSVNIPDVAKPLLKKNAINEIYTEDIKTQINNRANVKDITDKLESYKGKIYPDEYHRLRKKVSVYKRNLQGDEDRSTTRLTNEFNKQLDGLRTCIGTGNCDGNKDKLPGMINNSGLPNEQKKELIKRFDDIVELSDMFSEIDNELMGSFDKVDAYIKKNPDNIKNNAARNAILRKYLDDRIKEYDGDPVGFLMKHDKIIKELSEDLETLSGIDREEAESELRKTISHRTKRLMTNAEVSEVGKIDDYKEKSDKVMELIATRGRDVVDELVDKGALSEDFISISNLDDEITQYRAFSLLKDQEAIIKINKGTPNSYNSIEKNIKGSNFFINFAESIRDIEGGNEHGNSIAKLTTLELLKSGVGVNGLNDDNAERVFNQMLGDSWVYEKTLLPKTITEEVAFNRFDNIKSSYFWKKRLKLEDLYLRPYGFSEETEVYGADSLADDVESEDTKFIIRGNSVMFVKNGMFVEKKNGDIFTIPFDNFDLTWKENYMVVDPLLKKPGSLPMDSYRGGLM
jgi:hypothetical protein